MNECFVDHANNAPSILPNPFIAQLDTTLLIDLHFMAIFHVEYFLYSQTVFSSTVKVLRLFSILVRLFLMSKIILNSIVSNISQSCSKTNDERVTHECTFPSRRFMTEKH